MVERRGRAGEPPVSACVAEMALIELMNTLDVLVVEKEELWVRREEARRGADEDSRGTAFTNLRLGEDLSFFSRRVVREHPSTAARRREAKTNDVEQQRERGTSGKSTEKTTKNRRGTPRQSRFTHSYLQREGSQEE
jgi:hypothetical protein